VSSKISDEWLNLPKAYARDETPADAEEIASPEKLKSWR
jgi:hypothetical protein